MSKKTAFQLFFRPLFFEENIYLCKLSRALPISIISFLTILISVQSLVAQSYADESILFSRPGNSGTARVIGAGGAFGSIGADLGSVAINPASIGLFRSSDVSFTPALLVNRNQTQFNGNSTASPLNRLYFQQAGISFTKLFDNAAKLNDFSFNSVRLNAITFAINYQRQNIFDRSFRFNGYNGTRSGIQYFADYANFYQKPIDINSASIEGVLAWQTYLIDYDTASAAYYSNVSAPLSQSGRIERRGANDQIDVALGGNINDKLYFGAGVGISILTYTYNASFGESNSADSLSGFRNYNVSTFLRTTGIGVNARFGLIYRPISWMRFGVSYQIPTYYNATENFSADIYSAFDTGYNATGATANPFRYRLRTPMKGIFSASFFFKEHGFFSVDYELLNYAGMKYNFGRDYQSISDGINAEAKKNFAVGHAIRAGVEGAYKTLRVRGGYSIATSPYKKDFRTKEFVEVRHTASLGMGYRGQRFYADFAYQLGLMNDEKYPYADFVVQSNNVSHNLILTLGWKMNTAARKKAQKGSPALRDY